MDKIRDLFKNKLVKNGIWLLVLEAFNCVLPFLTIPYITRILTPDKYGVFSIGLSWISYLQILVIYAFDLSATRKLALCESEDEQKRIYTRVMTARFILCLLSVLILVAFFLFLQVSHETKLCMLVLFIMVVGNAIEHNWFFKGKEDVKQITIINVICRLVTTILIFLFVKDTSDILIYCLLYSVNYVFAGIFGGVLARVKYRIKLIPIRIREIGEELKEGFILFLSSAMTKIFAGFGVIYLGLVATDAIAGVYSALTKIPNLIITLWMPLSQVIYPAISKVFAVSFANGIRKLKKIALPILVIFASGLLVISVGHLWIVELLFGSDYLQDASVLIIMCVWVFVGIVNNFLGTQALVGSGHTKRYTISFLISLVCNLVLIVVLGNGFSLYGIAIANLFSEALLTVILFFQVCYLKKRETREIESNEESNVSIRDKTGSN